MLKRLVLYSIAAVAIGIIVMVAPIGLTLLLPQTSRMTTTQETATTEKAPETLTIPPPTASNLTESYGLTIDKLREMAQFYGILVSLTMVISAGLIAALIAKLIMQVLKRDIAK